MTPEDELEALRVSRFKTDLIIGMVVMMIAVAGLTFADFKTAKAFPDHGSSRAPTPAPTVEPSIDEEPLQAPTPVNGVIVDEQRDVSWYFVGRGAGAVVVVTDPHRFPEPVPTEQYDEPIGPVQEGVP